MDIKQVAQSVLNAMDEREKSYVDKGTSGGEYNIPLGGYTKTIGECIKEEFKGKPYEDLWYVFNLASHWRNDLEAWCCAALDGRVKEMF